jgi:AcrR family transcriptional regulator
LIKKGQKTREKLLENSRKLFNKKGTDLTLATIAVELGLNRSVISNHFPKKKELIYALAEQYEEKLTNLRNNLPPNLDFSFQSQAILFSEIIDLVFDYRSIIAYAMITPSDNQLMDKRFKKRYKHNIERAKDRLKGMIEQGLVSEDILAKQSFKLFEVQFMTVSSTWFISYALYYEEKYFKEIKPYVILSIFNAYHPFLTSKGQKQLDELKESLLTSSTIG